jgi:hypothetical protein
MKSHVSHNVASVTMHPAACGRRAAGQPSRYAPGVGVPTPGFGSFLVGLDAGNASPVSRVGSGFAK